MGYLIINNNLEIPILGFQEQAQEIENDRTGNAYIHSMSIAINLDELNSNANISLNDLFPFLINGSIISLKFKSAIDTDIIYTTDKYDHIKNINTNFGNLLGASDIQVQAQINLETPINIFNE